MIISIFGIIGNSLLIYILISKKQEFKSSTNHYLFHLAVADLFVCMILPWWSKSGNELVFVDT